MSLTAGLGFAEPKDEEEEERGGGSGGGGGEMHDVKGALSAQMDVKWASTKQ